ncbi:hypothetical protein [uncultured Bosea sp.]|jgi:hypothetical protein|uniref:Uncharacterized protein n=1 Tax=Bosea vestrisii TaxID=151416 RepID=A0ABW0HHX1_9HYPH|nr:hypothetical protein [uncultured Bosea sp.]
MIAHYLIVLKNAAPSRFAIARLQPRVLFYAASCGMLHRFVAYPIRCSLALRELLADGRSILEFTFGLAKMRAIAFDRKAAQKSLGDDLAEAFLSLVADMGNAMYLDELVDPPAAVRSDPVILEYQLGPDCILEVQPIGVHAVDMTNWATAHRVKLVRIVQNGAQLL